MSNQVINSLMGTAQAELVRQNAAEIALKQKTLSAFQAKVMDAKSRDANLVSTPENERGVSPGMEKGARNCYLAP